VHPSNLSRDQCEQLDIHVPEASGKENTGRWTEEEHQLFIQGLRLHKKQWKQIAELIKTRTVVQIRTHAQKYFQKLMKRAGGDESLGEKEVSDLLELKSIEGEMIKSPRTKRKLAAPRAKKERSNSSMSFESFDSSEINEREYASFNEEPKDETNSEDDGTESPRSRMKV